MFVVYSFARDEQIYEGVWPDQRTRREGRFGSRDIGISDILHGRKLGGGGVRREGEHRSQPEGVVNMEEEKQ